MAGPLQLAMPSACSTLCLKDQLLLHEHILERNGGLLGVVGVERHQASCRNEGLQAQRGLLGQRCRPRVKIAPQTS